MSITRSTRVSSSLFPEGYTNASVSVKPLGDALKVEVGLPEIIPELVDLVFPDTCFPISIEKIISSIPLNTPSSRTEQDIASWLNSLGCDLHTQVGLPILREWSSKCHRKSPDGSDIRRYPDIMLLDVGSDTAPHWQSIRALSETTREGVKSDRIIGTITQKSFIIFCKQLCRRFVPSLSFTKDHFCFTVCDRSGIIKTPYIPLNDDNKGTLLRALAGLALAKEKFIGYDETMHCGATGEIKSISVGNDEYTVVKNLFMARALKGRATQCWHVQKGGEDFIIKDSWINTKRTTSEIETLRILEDVKNVPRLIQGLDLPSPHDNGKIDSTLDRRHQNLAKENRVHRRLVMSPVAEPLSSFVSKKELIGALMDVVRTHSDCVLRKHILHRDISVNNVMLWRQSNADLHRRGLLIDFDYASKTDGTHDAAIDIGLTGTAPFMSIEIMSGECTQHEPRHDLESIFHLLLYFFMMFKGAGQPRTDKDTKDYQTFVMYKWFQLGKNLKELADDKTSGLMTLDRFRKHYVAKCDPYFDDLRPCMEDFYQLIFPSGFPNRCEATYDDLLKVLEQYYNALPDVDAKMHSENASNPRMSTPLVSKPPASNQLASNPPSASTPEPTVHSRENDDSSDHENDVSSEVLSSSTSSTPSLWHASVSSATTVYGSTKRSSANAHTPPPKRRVLSVAHPPQIVPFNIGGLASRLRDIDSGSEED